MLAPVIVLLAFVAPWTHARIQYFYDCTSYFPNTDYIYNTNSTACANTVADATCRQLYPTVNNAPFPTAGQSQDRPINCYSSSGGAINQTAISDAIARCPRTCGLCCRIKEYSCKNKENPRLTCATITPAQCRDPMLIPTIAEDCPLSCGFCANGPSPTTPSPTTPFPTTPFPTTRSPTIPFSTTPFPNTPFPTTRSPTTLFPTTRFPTTPSPPNVGGGKIIDEYNCTEISYSAGSREFIYSCKADACSNVEPDQVCEVLYPPADPYAYPDIYPKAGGNAARPFNCYNRLGRAGPPERQMVKAAIRLCPKTCGFCCKTDEYDCRNAEFPRINCAHITPDKCFDINWRSIIAEDCPSTCGLCNVGGCVDAVSDCDVDTSICYSNTMQSFVNTYCKRTCNRCRAPTTPDPGNGTCTSYIPDTSNACVEWDAKYGFCTQTESTTAEKRKYCATTCKIC